MDQFLNIVKLLLSCSLLPSMCLNITMVKVLHLVVGCLKWSYFLQADRWGPEHVVIETNMDHFLSCSKSYCTLFVTNPMAGFFFNYYFLSRFPFLQD